MARNSLRLAAVWMDEYIAYYSFDKSGAYKMSSLIYLSNEECSSATDAFLQAIYGEDVLSRWRELKCEMEFQSEREYMIWLLDAASQYKQNELDEQTGNYPLVDEGGGVKVEGEGSGQQSDECDEKMIPLLDIVEDDDGEMGFMTNNRLQQDLPANSSLYDGSLLSVSASSPKLKELHCPHCPYMTSNKSHLNVHIRGVHEKRKNHECPHCSYMSCQKAALNAHLIHKHGYTSRFACSKCGKHFAYQQHLAKHMLSCANSQLSSEINDFLHV